MDEMSVYQFMPIPEPPQPEERHVTVPDFVELELRYARRVMQGSLNRAAIRLGVSADLFMTLPDNTPEERAMFASISAVRGAVRLLASFSGRLMLVEEAQALVSGLQGALAQTHHIASPDTREKVESNLHLMLEQSFAIEGRAMDLYGVDGYPGNIVVRDDDDYRDHWCMDQCATIQIFRIANSMACSHALWACRTFVRDSLEQSTSPEVNYAREMLQVICVNIDVARMYIDHAAMFLEPMETAAAAAVGTQIVFLESWL